MVLITKASTGPHSTVVNMSDCRSRGREFDPGQSYTFAEIDYEIISMAILLPFAVSRRVDVSDNRKYVHEVLVNCLVKRAQEKVWLGELTIVVDWDVKNQTKQKASSKDSD